MSAGLVDCKRVCHARRVCHASRNTGVLPGSHGVSSSVASCSFFSALPPLSRPGNHHRGSPAAYQGPGPSRERKQKHRLPRMLTLRGISPAAPAHLPTWKEWGGGCMCRRAQSAGAALGPQDQSAQLCSEATVASKFCPSSLLSTGPCMGGGRKSKGNSCLWEWRKEGGQLTIWGASKGQHRRCPEIGGWSRAAMGTKWASEAPGWYLYRCVYMACNGQH